MFLWKKRPEETRQSEPKTAETQKESTYTPEPTLTGSKLKELSWSLDILEMKKK